MTRRHRILVLIIGGLLPLASWAFGDGALSYGMYAHASEYRLDAFALDAVGARHRIAPTALAEGARASVVPVVAGADRWRHQPRRDELRGALSGLAAHGCTVARGARSIELVLEERAREGDAVRTTRVVVGCEP